MIEGTIVLVKSIVVQPLGQSLIGGNLQTNKQLWRKFTLFGDGKGTSVA
jgi:hypothetical protein